MSIQVLQLEQSQYLNNKQKTMFIISLNYKVPLEEIDKYLAAHVAYLDKQYALGNFQTSGRKIPRTGGIILSQLKDKTVLQKTLEKDPFHAHDLADYELIEFIPSKATESFKHLLEE